MTQTAATDALIITMLNALSIHAQSAPSEVTPKFEVASIRLSKDCTSGPGGGGMPPPGTLNMQCMSVVSFMESAYVLFANGHQNSARSHPILGGPRWIESDQYDIKAKAEGDPRLSIMRGPMLQALLEDRFKLKIHREIRQVPVYALTVAKRGPKLKPFKEGSCTLTDLDHIAPRVQGQPPFCRNDIGARGPNLSAFVEVQGMGLDEFAKFLTLSLDRPVINKTGVAGVFDFHLEFQPDQTTPRMFRGGGSTESDAAGGPSILTAIQEQLGLRLQPAKGPSEFLVIDHIERPSEN